MDDVASAILLLVLIMLVLIGSFMCAGMYNPRDDGWQQLIDSCTIEHYEPACKALER